METREFPARKGLPKDTGGYQEIILGLLDMVETTIRQARAQDKWTISRFLAEALFVHKHLDWKAVLDWIEDVPFLLYFEGTRLSGVLSCAADPPGVNWIHCFASLTSMNPTLNFSRFLDELKQSHKTSVTTLYSVGLQDWFCRVLDTVGSDIKQNIVVLAWNGTPSVEKSIPEGFTVRPMEPSDLEQVLLLDNIAFEPIWSFSKSALAQAYLQSEHASVAEKSDRIIGYELTTANHFSAHLARLAVNPDFQGHNVGTTLVTEMIKYFTSCGQSQITVNTQDDNYSSLALYKKLNFQLTGDSFPVYALKVS